ncbi:MAG: adenylate kinase [Terriglobia bacterium]
MVAGLHPEPPVGISLIASALVLVGPPGAGKGTQSHAIAAEFGIPEISTGHMLRDAVQRKTPLGIAAQASMESGVLVPDELVCRLVKERIGEPDCARGFIMDGFPRNLNQAVFLERLLCSKGGVRMLALNIRVNQETLLMRLAGRRVCPACGTNYNIFFSPPRKEGVCDNEGCALAQRPDDNEEVIRRRLGEYERQTQPLVDHYRSLGLLREVDGSGTSGTVTAAIFAILRAS